MNQETTRRVKNLVLFSLINEIATRTIKNLDGSGLNLTKDNGMLSDSILVSMVGARINHALSVNVISEQE